jgi:hypothetical protein
MLRPPDQRRQRHLRHQSAVSAIRGCAGCPRPYKVVMVASPQDRPYPLGHWPREPYRDRASRRLLLIEATTAAIALIIGRAIKV